MLLLDERFWSKVRKGAEGECWPWRTGRRGYYYLTPRAQGGKMIYAYRCAYLALVGPVPKGLVLDHLCRNPACVNPKHLEPVTYRENRLRGAGERTDTIWNGYCKLGHAIEGENVIRAGTCRRCNHAAQRRWWIKNREKLKPQRAARRAREKAAKKARNT